jgi:hypothetical protein
MTNRTNELPDRRDAEHRVEPETIVAGERRGGEQRGVLTSMVDALEDILKWERESERAMRVASVAPPVERDVSTRA